MFWLFYPCNTFPLPTLTHVVGVMNCRSAVKHSQHSGSVACTVLAVREKVWILGQDGIVKPVVAVPHLGVGAYILQFKLLVTSVYK